MFNSYIKNDFYFVWKRHDNIQCISATWSDSESKRSVNYIVCIVENVLLGGEIHDFMIWLKMTKITSNLTQSYKYS